MHGHDIDFDFGWSWFWTNIIGVEQLPQRGNGGVLGLAFQSRHRWQMYLTYLQNLQKSSYNPMWSNFGRYICQEWNKGRYFSEQLYAFSIVNIAEVTNISQTPATEPGTSRVKEEVQKPTSMWRHSCFDLKAPPKYHERIPVYKKHYTDGGSGDVDANNQVRVRVHACVCVWGARVGGCTAPGLDRLADMREAALTRVTAASYAVTKRGCM